MTLATSDPCGAWAATVNYVPLREPLRLLWYSLRRVRHSRNIESGSRVSGSVFLTGLPVAAVYYDRNFPDEGVRRQWRLPLDEFQGASPRRFYMIIIDASWLIDIDQWLIEKNDQRVAVHPPALSAEPVEGAAPS
ncbi:hypothetical protein E1287_30720 [Actinomadura sp. KC06]|nr:hypothetical protein E1287_30720 [Actinomadura sp. KC06]